MVGCWKSNLSEISNCEVSAFDVWVKSFPLRDQAVLQILHSEFYCPQIMYSKNSLFWIDDTIKGRYFNHSVWSMTRLMQNFRQNIKRPEPLTWPKILDDFYTFRVWLKIWPKWTNSYYVFLDEKRYQTE